MPLESCWEPMVSLWLVLIIGKDSGAQSRNIKVKVYEISLTDVNSMKEYKNIASTRYFGCKIAYILLFLSLFCYNTNSCFKQLVVTMDETQHSSQLTVNKRNKAHQSAENAHLFGN